MTQRNRIATYYNNARILVQQKNPKAARAYVLEILNAALEQYHKSTTIVAKMRTEVFMEQWIAVSRDLYEKGITDYVLECFALTPKKQTPVAGNAETPKKQTPVAEKPKADVSGGDIDIKGLLDGISEEQGWCAAVFEANKKAVVEISASSAQKGSAGTGFIISRNGYLLTNDHIVFDGDTNSFFPKVTMSFAGEKKKYKLEVLFSDKDRDVALCKFDAEKVEGYSVVKRTENYGELQQGADCLVIGNAFDMGLAPFAGVVRFTKNDEGNLVYTAPSNPGDSGGPVFNRKGECIGINKSKTFAVNGTMADAYANATPMDEIDKLLEKWTKVNHIVL